MQWDKLILHLSEKDRNYGKDLPSVDAEQQTTYAYHCVSIFVSKLANSLSAAQYLSHDTQWRPSEYVVSEKADGQRCFVLCNCDGKVWCLRPRKKKFQSSHCVKPLPVIFDKTCLLPYCCEVLSSLLFPVHIRATNLRVWHAHGRTLLGT